MGKGQGRTKNTVMSLATRSLLRRARHLVTYCSVRCMNERSKGGYRSFFRGKPKWDQAEKETFSGEHSLDVKKGMVYHNLPVKMPLEAGKTYAWCTCGQSKCQPMCDGFHKELARRDTSFEKTDYRFKPHRFKVDKTDEYWLCNCKRTDNRPFCDGSHKGKKRPTTPTGRAQLT